MRSGLGVVLGIVLVATLVVAAPAGAKAPTGLDALPGLSASNDPLEYVGDADGLRLGISIVSETEAVAYLCDGETVGVWFTGSVDLDTGAGTLKSKDGDTITVDLNAGPPTATVVLDGKTTTFTLAPVTGNGGVFRFVTSAKGHRWTTGWIVANDGSIIGLTADPTGKPVAAVTPNSASTAGGGGAEPVTEGALRCSILRARVDRQLGKATTAQGQGNAAGVAAGNANATDLNNRFNDLGCTSSANGGIAAT